MLKYEAFLLFISQLALGLLVILYLLVFEDMTLGTVWNDYGIPLMIFAVVFTAYPLLRLYKK